MDFVSSSIPTFSIISYDHRVAGGATLPVCVEEEEGVHPLRPGICIGTGRSGSRDPCFVWRLELVHGARTVALRPEPGQAPASPREK